MRTHKCVFKWQNMELDRASGWIVSWGDGRGDSSLQMALDIMMECAARADRKKWRRDQTKVSRRNLYRRFEVGSRTFQRVVQNIELAFSRPMISFGAIIVKSLCRSHLASSAYVISNACVALIELGLSCYTDLQGLSHAVFNHYACPCLSVGFVCSQSMDLRQPRCSWVRDQIIS